MALPISITPTLRGKDAERFEKIIAKSDTEKISKEEREYAIDLMKTILKNSEKQLKE